MQSFAQSLPSERATSTFPRKEAPHPMRLLHRDLEFRTSASRRSIPTCTTTGWRACELLFAKQPRISGVCSTLLCAQHKVVLLLCLHLLVSTCYLSVCPHAILCSLSAWSVCEGGSVPFQSLSDLVVGEESCIVGTLFKRMDLKPSILKAITQEVSQQTAQCV